MRFLRDIFSLLYAVWSSIACLWRLVISVTIVVVKPAVLSAAALVVMLT